MRTPFRFLLLALVVFLAATAQAQQSGSDPITRPRLAADAPAESKARSQEPTVQRPAPRAPESTDKTSSNPARQDEPRDVAREQSARRLTPNRLRMRINEATRLMKARPMPTAMTPSLDYVTLAALQPETSKIHLFRIDKRTFLTRGAAVPAISTLGLSAQINIVRANGVNTAVNIFDGQNRSLLPLVVEFPIEHRGVYKETAYYTSAHPALLSVDLLKTGQTYVNSMIDLAAKRLRERGNPINPSLVEIAKHLCVVEHIDHERFRNENRIALFEEIYTLYSLNELDTYRFS